MDFLRTGAAANYNSSPLLILLSTQEKKVSEPAFGLIITDMIKRI